MSDAGSALIEPVFTSWRAGRTGPGTAARMHDLLEIVNAVGAAADRALHSEALLRGGVDGLLAL
ncbi:hypothetical protein [Streptomyces sp. NPDC001020]